MVAHSGSAPEFATTMLVGGGTAFAWIGLSRLRARGFPGLPRWIGVAMLALAPAAIVGTLLVPSLFRPTALSTGPRPASSASIAFAEPEPGQLVTSDELDVSVRIENGTFVERSSTNVEPETGHLHIFLDGELLSMTSGGDGRIDVGWLTPGEHRLRAEFVAADHAPFDPPVVAAVTFVKRTP